MQTLETLEPAREIREPAQRRDIAPLQIVDRYEQRPSRSSIYGQPVQPMQESKQIVLASAYGLVRLRSSEQAQRAACRVAEQIIPRRVVELDN
jgi:hypothetical protein